jgi:hypothetical protein
VHHDAAAHAEAAPRLVFFDLDGTVARHDTLLPYVARYLLPRPWRWWRLAGVLAPLLGFVLGRGDRGALKGARPPATSNSGTRASCRTCWPMACSRARWRPSRRTATRAII